MPGEVFVDTNILVYAYDRDAGTKHDRANALVAELWKRDRPPWISVQVLQEFFVNLLRRGVAHEQARATVMDYAQWQVVQNTTGLVEKGMAEMARWKISFWDALVVAAARQAGATELLSEDFAEGMLFAGIRVVNPLKPVSMK